MARRCWLLLSVVPLLFAAACGGSDVVSGVGGESGDTLSTTPPPVNPSFSQDVNPIFGAKGCTAGNCHGGGSGGMTLSSSVSNNYANLVNVPASAAPSFMRVEPNDATNSYLVMKVEGRAGSRMPLGGSPLSSNQITTIRNWIDSGAPNN